MSSLISSHTNVAVYACVLHQLPLIRRGLLKINSRLNSGVKVHANLLMYRNNGGGVEEGWGGD